MGHARSLDLPDRWDELVGASTDLDRFCSGSAWASTAHEVFGRRTRLVTAAGGAAAVALARSGGPWRARALCGLDPQWGFACPVVGPDVIEGAALVADVLRAGEGHWDVALLTGLVPGSRREAAVLARLERRYRLHPGPEMTRRVADLEAGPEAWLARRGAHFRRNLRRAVRAAERAGLDLTPVEGGAELVGRAAAVDAWSWKGVLGSGLAEPAMARFYRALAGRLGPARLRAHFARLADRDVGYILGGVGGELYRGFQLAHRREVRALSVGNLLQWCQIRALAAEGVTRYDLGMDMAYKVAWADEALTTRTLVVLGPPG